MSDRRIPIQETALKSTIRDILDRLDRLDQGSVLRGRVSFGPEIQIGDLLLRVTNGAGTHRTLHIINTLSGAESTIVL